MPLPLPAVPRFDCSLDIENEVIVPRVHGFLRLTLIEGVHGWIADTPEAWMTPHGETYLRLAEINLDDPEAILGFVQEYGPLGGGLAYASLTNRADYFKLHHGGRRDPRKQWIKKRQALANEIARELGREEPKRAREVAPRTDDWWDRYLFTTLTQVPPVTETLSEFRFAARLLRDLYSAWRMYKDGLDVDEIEWLSPTNPGALTVHDPAAFLHETLRNFLSDFSPQLLLSWSYGDDAQVEDVLKASPDVTRVEPVRGPEVAPLYAVCALELFNHIIANAQYHVCDNERCERTFVHQQGRSKKGQHRNSGVKYCSGGCARATAQRQYRKRRLNRERVGDEREAAGASNGRVSGSPSPWSGSL